MKQTDDGIELNSAEAGQMLWLYALMNQQTKPEREEILRALAKAAGVAREYGLLKSSVKKACDSIMNALSADQQRRLIRTMKAHTVQLVSTAAYAVKSDYMCVLHQSDLDKLVTWARQWHGCDVCMKDDKAARKCELRRLLIGVTPPDEHALHGCEYVKDGAL